jgi:hypothetical protein
LEQPQTPVDRHAGLVGLAFGQLMQLGPQASAVLAQVSEAQQALLQVPEPVQVRVQAPPVQAMPTGQSLALVQPLQTWSRPQVPPSEQSATTLQPQVPATHALLADWVEQFTHLLPQAVAWFRQSFRVRSQQASLHGCVSEQALVQVRVVGLQE